MRPIGEIIKHEIRELAPVVIYFFIALNILGLTRTLILRQYGITVSTFFNATIGALVVAKVVLVVGVLPFRLAIARSAAGLATSMSRSAPAR